MSTADGKDTRSDVTVGEDERRRGLLADSRTVSEGAETTIRQRVVWLLPLVIVFIIGAIALLSLWPSGSGQGELSQLSGDVAGVAVLTDDGSFRFHSRNGGKSRTWELWGSQTASSPTIIAVGGTRLLTLAEDGTAYLSTLDRASNGIHSEIAASARDVDRSETGFAGLVMDTGNVRSWDPTLEPGERARPAWIAADGRPAATAVAVGGRKLAFLLDNGNAWTWDADGVEGSRGAVVWGRGQENAATAIGIGGDIAATVLSDGAVRTVDLRTENVLFAWGTGEDRAEAVDVDVTSDGVVIVLLSNGNVRRFDPRAPEGERANWAWNTRDGERAGAVAISAGRDGRVAFALENGTVRVSDPSQPEGERLYVAWSPPEGDSTKVVAIEIT